MSLAPILVVDDESEMRTALSHALNRGGFSVESAASGTEALIKLKKDAYSMVITDMKMPEISGMEYEAVGIQDGGGEYSRLLPRYTELEASVTVGGGGWGAENVGGRKDNTSSDNYIVVRGTITEVVRGVVGAGSNGYKKRYYLDERLLEGILPGDIWLKGKYIPAPAGWHDYRPEE